MYTSYQKGKDWMDICGNEDILAREKLHKKADILCQMGA